MAKFKWRTKYFLSEIRKMNEDSIEDSCKLITNTVKDSIIKDPLPSLPGNLPKGKSGLLKASMSYQTSSGKSGGITSPADPSDGVKRPSANYNEVVGVVGSNVRYANYVEEGTSKMAPRPYLRRALAKSMNEIKTIFRKNGRKYF